MKMANLGSAAFIIAVITLSSYSSSIGGTLKGSINPINGGVKCWAMSAKDTFQSNIVNGMFELNSLKPGVYRISIQAMAPYKNAIRDGVGIREGEITDIGEIRLQQ